MHRFFGAMCFFLALATQASADDTGMGGKSDIMIHDGWARASIGQASNSAAYMTIMTHGDSPDTLIAASTPIADRAELHNHTVEDGIAKMRRVETIDVMPGEPVTLEPGGLHVMLMGLKEKLEAGATLPLTLTFEQAGDVTMELPIKDAIGQMNHSKAHKHGS